MLRCMYRKKYPIHFLYFIPGTGHEVVDVLGAPFNPFQEMFSAFGIVFIILILFPFEDVFRKLFYFLPDIRLELLRERSEKSAVIPS